MSNERPEIRKIDAKIGRMIGQFSDLTAEMRRLYEAEMEATDLLQKILAVIAHCDEEWVKSTETAQRDLLHATIDDIEALCKEELKS